FLLHHRHPRRSLFPYTTLFRSGGVSSCKSLISFTNIHAERRHSGGEDIGRCVFFTQHLSEIVQFVLWAGRFFVACRNPSDKVIVRRRGSPKSIRPVFSGSERPGGFGD